VYNVEVKNVFPIADENTIDDVSTEVVDVVE
jgi:hypothetical protein